MRNIRAVLRLTAGALAGVTTAAVLAALVPLGATSSADGSDGDWDGVRVVAEGVRVVERPNP